MNKNFSFTPIFDNGPIHMAGIIYNMDMPIMSKKLTDISSTIDYEPLIRDFVEQADGEYLIELKLSNGKTVIFNDKWGRIPTYYSLTLNGFICQNSFSRMIELTNHRAINQIALTESLSMGQVLGKKTLINGINYLLPASILVSNSFSSEVKQVIPSNFEEPKETLSREECVVKCKDLFIEAVESRAKTLINKRYELYADLSGGKDTRAVFGALNQLGYKPRLLNMGFCGEAEVATQLAHAYGFPITITPKPDTSGYNSALTYEDAFIIDYFTAQLCYGERNFRKAIFKYRKVANFMGLGGDFIRHPIRLSNEYKSIDQAITQGMLIHYFTLQDACAMTGVDITEFKNHLRDHYGEWPETTLAGRARHKYFEYYNRIDNSAEHRSRAINWTVSPFLSKKLFDFETSVIPDKFIDEKFFIQFLRAIDSRLLEFPFWTVPSTRKSTDGGTLKGAYRKLFSHPIVVTNWNQLARPITKELEKLKSNHLDKDGVAMVLQRPHDIWHQRYLMAAILFMQELEKK